MSDKLSGLLAKINKQYGEGTILPASKAVGLIVDRFPTGIFDLDIKIGGGYPRGRIIVLKGEYSTGKSAVCLRATASAQSCCRFCGQKFERIDLLGEVHKVKCKCKKPVPMRVVWVDSEHCLAEGSLVYSSAEGRYVPVEDLCGKEAFETLSFDSTGAYKKTGAVVSGSGVREVYRVKASGGRVLNLTGNHEVLTDRGYLLIEQVVPGDCIYTPQEIDSGSSTEEMILNQEYRLLGLHIGDGLHGEASISNVDPEVIEDIAGLVKPFGCWINVHKTNVDIVAEREEFRWSRSYLQGLWDKGMYISEMAQICGCGLDTLVFHLEKYGICNEFDRRSRASQLKLSRVPRIQIPDQNMPKGRKNEVHLWLEQFECFHQKSKQRRLPKSLSLGQLAQVLAGIFMADGMSIDPDNQRRATASFSTGSLRLAMDIQAALMRFRVYSALSVSTKGEYDPTYVVTVSGVNNVRRFISEIPIYSYKLERLERAVSTLINRNRKQVTENLIALEVKSIEKLAKKVQTYDVSLDERDHDKQNFLAEGVLVHNSFDPEWAKKWGIDIDKMYIIETEYAEQAIDVADACIRSRECDLLICDSVAALTPGIEVEQSSENWQMGVMARLMNKALRKWTSGLNSAGLLSETKCTILLVNQMRANIGGYGAKMTSPGGKGIDFFESIEIRFKRTDWIVEETSDRPVGINVEYVVKKNKTAPGGASGRFDLYFVRTPPKYIVGSTDIDYQVLRSAVYWGLIQKGGSWFTFPDGKKAHGEAKAADMLYANPKLLDTLDQAIRAKEFVWAETGEGVPVDEEA